MYTDKEYLQAALESGMIDITTLKAQIEMAEKKKYLEGHNIWKGKNGSWYTKLVEDGQKRLIRKSTKEAIEKEIIKYEKGLEDDPDVRTVFYRFINQKLRYKEISKSTYDRYERDYERFFKGKDIEKIKFNLLTVDILEDFIRCSISDNDLTSKGYGNLRTILRGMLLFAKGKYTSLSATSFFGDLHFSRNTFRKNVIYKEKQVFLEDEVKIINDYLSNIISLQAFGIRLAFQTGIRVGELSTICKDDISIVNGITSIHIQRTETKYKGENGKVVVDVKEYPKSSAGDRYVYCNNKAVELLNSISELSEESMYLFADSNGRINSNKFDMFLRRSCRKCCIPVKSMHKIRKTYGTTLIDGGVDEAVIIEQMGHSDIHCTKQYYYYSNKSREHKKLQLDKVDI